MTSAGPTRWFLLFLSCILLSAWSGPPPGTFKLPDRMRECEGQDQQTCGIWTFNGVDGTGQWDGGAVADLLVQQSDPAWIIIRRSDTSGTSPGLTAIYVGKLNGDRIEGKVTWTWLGHWDQQVEGTWFATLEQPESSATGPAPRAPRQTSPAPGRDRDRAAKGEAHAAQLQAASPKATARPGQNEVCASRRIRVAMQSIENLAIKDPNGAALTLLTLAFTGINARSDAATILASHNGSDGGRYTSKAPGSFVCVGVFVHGDLQHADPAELSRGGVHIDTASWADGVAELTAAAAQQIMKTFPPYKEWYLVRPLKDGRYQLTLLPAGLELSREYSTQFTYPAP